MKIQEELIAMGDKEYAIFQQKLIPGIELDQVIGVRVPVLRDYAKKLMKERPEEAEEFLNTLPHDYYDENILHGALLSLIKDYEQAMELMEKFLPFIDNWAVCDTTKPKVFGKHKEEVLTKIRKWTKSKHTYTCRFGMLMLMSFYLDGDFDPSYLEIPAKVVSEEYYVNMMAAWFFATALAKQWDATIPYIENNCLGTWVHNKTIQKARESFRITAEQKEYLKTLKRGK